MSETAEAKFIAVALENGFEKLLDYRLPANSSSIALGSLVEVPLRGKIRKGFVVSFLEKSSYEKVEEVIRILPEETWIPPKLYELGKWMAEYYCTSISKVFASMIPTGIRKEIKQKEELWITLKKTLADTTEEISKLREKSPLQAAILDLFIQDKKGHFQSDLIDEKKFSKSSLSTLIKKRFLESRKMARNSDFLFDEDYFQTKPKTLSSEQDTALKSIRESLEKKSFASHLLYGVTGSGKTEVYMQAMQTVLDRGQSALILVPEVALTAQAIERFKARFQEKIAVLHHRRSQGERFQAWKMILNDEIRIILGARSAVFCPAKNLGLIIVDEEHDSSYKQMEEAPSYHARDIALMRGKIENACVVLGSATPSFESYTNALRGKYILNTLTQRPASLLPKVKIIEMKQEMDKRGGFTHFSAELLAGLKQRTSAGEQSLILLNRRGYYTSIFCPTCSLIQKCPDCAMALAFHKGENLLRCHLCDRTSPPLRICPSCNKSTMEYKGFGTEHVEKSLKALFPELRTLRMDRDTTQKKHSHEQLISQFRAGKADVLIGTQMIAKGLHFPAVTLVGILNIDGALGIPDFRSSEYIFQLITQVAGRAGRASLPGEVIIQTFLPDHETIQLAAKQDYKAFYEKEIPMRKHFGYPPFSRFAKIIFSGPDEEKVKNLAGKYRQRLFDFLNKDYEVFPLSPAGHAKVKGNFRFQFLIMTAKILPLSKVLQEVKQEIRLPANFKLLIDIDPVATFF